MHTYEIAPGGLIVRLVEEDMSFMIPESREAALLPAQQDYLDWLEAGGVPKPYVPPIVIPPSASKLGLRRVFVEQGIWEQVRALIAADPDRQEEWDLAIEIKRTDALVQTMIAAMDLTEAQVDAIMIRQAELV